MNPILKMSICFLFVILIFSSCAKKNHPPTVENQEFSIPENSSQGTLVGKVVAMDEDNDTSMTYSIISGNTNNAFGISESGGKITVLNEDAIDFETNPEFTLTVEVRDSRNSGSAAFITVNLTDVVPPTNGLLVYYPFNGNTSDSSGNGNNCSSNISSNFVAGKWGQGVDFNGTSDYLQLSNTLNSAYGLTFSFWFNSRGPKPTENNGSIICKYSMSSEQRCFMVYSFGSGATKNDNRLSAAFYRYEYSSAYHDNTKSYLEPAELSIYPSDPSLWTISNPKRIVPGTWTHCVVNMTSTTLEVWLDGILCTKKVREYAYYFDTPYEPVYIGNNFAIGEGQNNHYNGILDEMRVYNRGLTEEEIKTLFKER
jgi:hypothetical protein